MEITVPMHGEAQPVLRVAAAPGKLPPPPHTNPSQNTAATATAPPRRRLPHQSVPRMVHAPKPGVRSPRHHGWRSSDQSPAHCPAAVQILSAAVRRCSCVTKSPGHPLTHSTLRPAAAARTLAASRLRRPHVGGIWYALSTGGCRILTSLQDLRRPLRDRRRGAVQGAPGQRESLRTLRLLMQNGDEKTKALADALARHLMHETIVARMHDHRRGPLPRFVRRIGKAVDSFRDHIR